MRILATLSLFLALAGCADSYQATPLPDIYAKYDYVNEAENCAAMEPVGSIDISCSFGKDERALLVGDLEYLQHMTFRDTEKGLELKTKLGLDKLSGQALFRWLKGHLHYLLSSSFDPRLGNIKDEYAVNYGVVRYRIAQMFRLPPPRVNIPGHGQMVLTDLNQGMVRVGQGFFKEESGKWNKPGLARWRRTMRLAILIHEGRHGDGFVHSVCPVGHLYEGKMLCDSPDGSYGIESLFLAVRAEECSDCTDLERRFLSLDAETYAENVIR